MVSNAKNKGNKKKTTSISTSNKSTRSKNGPKMKPLIEIASSSYIESVSKVDIAKTPIADIGENQGQSGLEEKVSRIESSIEVMIKGINNLVNVVASHTPILSPMNMLSTNQLLHTQTKTCLPHSPSMQEKNADDILAKVAEPNNDPGVSKKKKKSRVKTNVTAKDNTLKRRLFSHTIAGKNYAMFANMDPLHNAELDGLKATIEIPKWIPMTFRPSPTLIMDDVQSCVFAYIFGTNKDDDIHGKEFIVKTSYSVFGYRENFKTLAPKGFVDQQVLNMVACMLTDQERSISSQAEFWFLPTTVAQYALGIKTTPEQVMEYYQKDFMGKIDYLGKIFVPINDKRKHWYLLVVDLREKKLIMLDSKPDPNTNAIRRLYAMKLAIFLEEMFWHESFYQYEFTAKPKISAYQFVMPNDIGEQLPDSNDCGIWVGKWMMDCLWSDDYKITVDDDTRMMIALDLILSPYNTNKNEVIKFAAANWKNFEEKKKRLVVE